MILLIDNYDSFSYNLYQLVGAIDPDIRVIRNDELRIEEIDALHPARIILSPGPGRPGEAGVCEEAARRRRRSHRRCEDALAPHPDAWRVPRASGHLCRLRCDRDLC